MKTINKLNKTVEFLDDLLVDLFPSTEFVPYEYRDMVGYYRSGLEFCISYLKDVQRKKGEKKYGL